MAYGGLPNAPRGSFAIEPTDANRTQWIQLEPHTTSIDPATGIERWKWGGESSSADAKLVVHPGSPEWERTSGPDELYARESDATTSS